MNKKFIIGLVVVGVVLAGAFFFLIPKSSQLSDNGDSTTGKDQDAMEVADLFTKAFTGNESIKCTFSDNGSTGTAYIKQGKIRFDSAGVDGAQYGNAIVNGSVVYVWQTGNNEGIMIDTSKYQSANGGLPDQVMDAEKIKQEVEKNKPNCVKENIDDSVFTPPSTVKFTDYSSFMNQQTQPTGAMTQEQLENLMQQYQQ